MAKQPTSQPQPASDQSQQPAKATGGAPKPDDKQVVQLTSNVGDRQIGETMTRAEAKRRGIDPAHLRHFDRQTDRMMRSGDAEQH